MFCKRCGVEISSYSQGLHCPKCDSIPNVQFQPQTVEQDIQQAISRITGMNESLPCTENQVAIQMLEASLFWLNERTRKRKEQGLEGTNKPHSS